MSSYFEVYRYRPLGPAVSSSSQLQIGYLACVFASVVAINSQQSVLFTGAPYTPDRFRPMFSERLLFRWCFWYGTRVVVLDSWSCLRLPLIPASPFHLPSSFCFLISFFIPPRAVPHSLAFMLQFITSFILLEAVSSTCKNFRDLERLPYSWTWRWSYYFISMQIRGSVIITLNLILLNVNRW